MGAAPEGGQWLSIEEYLKAEELSETRHEYCAGRIIGIPEMTVTRNTIIVNIATKVHRHSVMIHAA
jgi:hypothetical protein